MKPTIFCLTSARRMMAAATVSLMLFGCSTPEQKSEAHTKSGDELLKAGDISRASIEYRSALKLDDKNEEAWKGLANAEEKRQNWALVAQSLQRVTEIDPKDVDARLRLAKLKFAALQLDAALKDIEAANELKANDPDILALRAAIRFRNNDAAGAKADAEKALALSDATADAYAVLAAEKMQTGDAKGALLFIERGLEKDPKNIGLSIFQLKVFEAMQNFSAIEDVLKRLAAAYPEQREFKQALISFLISRNRPDDAIGTFSAMVEENPQDKQIALDYVRLLANTKGTDAARQELQKLIGSRPDQVDFKLALAQLDFANGKQDQAVNVLQEIIAKKDPKDHVNRAQNLLAEFKRTQGKKDEAKSLIKAILDVDPKNSDALAIRALMEMDDNQYDAAVTDLREALNQQPKSIQFMVLLAKALELQGAVALAIDRYAGAVKDSNYSPDITLGYVELLTRRGRTDRIEPVLEEALKRNPRDARLLAAMAQAKLARQDWDGAQKIAEQLKLAGGQGSGLDMQILGAAQLGANNLSAGVETLKAALEDSPQSVQALYSLTYAYLRAGKLDEAEQAINKALETNPKSADILALRGSLQLARKQPDAAEASFKQAIADDPSNGVGYIGLSNFYLSEKKRDEAQKVLTQGAEKLKNNLAINLALAGLKETDGDVEGAIAIYESQFNATPDAFVVVNNLASLLADYRTDEASLNRAYTLSQRLESIDVPQFLDTMGWIAYRRGDYRTALAKLEKAAAGLPNFGLVQYHLGMTYIALKRYPDAKKQLDHAASLLADGDPLKDKIKAELANLPQGQ